VNYARTVLINTAFQMLLAGVSRELIRDALLVTNRALRKWIKRFNQCLLKGRKIIRAFGSGHFGCYRQPGENPTNHRYRNVILTNALRQLLFRAPTLSYQGTECQIQIMEMVY
jgi:hypothetical protein